MKNHLRIAATISVIGALLGSTAHAESQYTYGRFGVWQVAQAPGDSFCTAYSAFQNDTRVMINVQHDSGDVLIWVSNTKWASLVTQRKMSDVRAIFFSTSTHTTPLPADVYDHSFVLRIMNDNVRDLEVSDWLTMGTNDHSGDIGAFHVGNLRTVIYALYQCDQKVQHSDDPFEGPHTEPAINNFRQQNIALQNRLMALYEQN